MQNGSPEIASYIRFYRIIDGQKVVCFIHLDSDNVYIGESMDPSFVVEESQRATGLGDVLESALSPIAKFIDDRFGTDYQNCEDCKSRKEKLNQAFPFTD